MNMDRAVLECAYRIAVRHELVLYAGSSSQDCLGFCGSVSRVLNNIVHAPDVLVIGLMGTRLDPGGVNGANPIGLSCTYGMPKTLDRYDSIFVPRSVADTHWVQSVIRPTLKGRA